MSYTKMPPVRTEAELTDLAQHIVGGRVVAADDVAERDPSVMAMVFMPILFGGLKGYTEAQLARLYVFAIQGVDKSAGLALNGWPMFIEIRVWRRRDAAKAFALAAKAMAVLSPSTNQGEG